MGNKYTEQENTWAAMISNCIITTDQIDWAKQMIRDDLIAQGRGDEYDPNYIPTFADIVKACNLQNPPYRLWFRDMTGDEPDFFNKAIDDSINPPLNYANWKIVGIYDDNDNSGFYAVAIETGEYTTNHVENGVIFSVRGTEPTTNEQKYLDIVNTDLMIINSDVTAQELVMYDYLDNEFATLLEQKGYSNLATTGHSLGGYLSFSAAAHIMLQKNSCANAIFMQGTNIDGPGVTEENLEVNKDIYAKLDPYLTHYHYTYVGSILTPICSKYISITGASDPSDYLEDMPEEYYEWMINHFGPEMTEHINTLFRYYNAHTGKHSLASLQFVNDGDFDSSYVENHNYIEVSDMELSPYSFDGLVGVIFETIVVLIVNQLYNESMNYDDSVEFDLWAGIVNKATELIDDNDQLQIFSGGIIDAVTIFMNEFYLTDEYAEFSESFEEFAGTYREMVVHFVEIMSDSSIDVEQWFALVDDVMTLAEDFDYEEMSSDGKAVAVQFIDTIGHISSNIMSMCLTMAENAGVVNTVTDHIYNRQIEMMACTSSIIHNVESLDAAEERLKAQRTFTRNCITHSNTLKELVEEFKDDATALCLDYQAYTTSTTSFFHTITMYLAGPGCGVTKDDLQNAVAAMNNTTKQLLRDYAAVHEDGSSVMIEVGSAIKDFITDNFRYAFSNRVKEVNDAILMAGNNLYNTMEEYNLAGSISDWVIRVTGQYNDATEHIYGLTGGIVIWGTNNADALYGNFGDSTIYGFEGNDTLEGGSGNDYLSGDAGSDKYVFNIGDGTDTIYDYEWDMGNIDKISFGSGISAEDVVMERDGNNLVVKYSANDSFTVQNAYMDYYGTGRYFVEQMNFSDGTVWDTEAIANRANIRRGTEGNDTSNGFGEAVGYHQSETYHMGQGDDTVYAGEGDDVIYGEEGNDALYAYNGNDTLVGGAGNDYLSGDAGNDKYVFNIGDGNDTVYDYEWDMGNIDKISFGAGISAEDVIMERDGNNLVVKYSANDSFTVQNAYMDYYGTGRYFVEQMEFADGTVWDMEAIANRANIRRGTDGNDMYSEYGEAVGYHQSETYHMGQGNDIVFAGEGNDVIHGEEGNDTLYAGNGNDTLVGGSGNDYLSGDAGNDKYVFNIGDGNDTVYDYEWDMGNIDKISFGSGISAEDVVMERDGNHLVVKYSANDSFTVQNAYMDYYGTGRYFVEQMEFADGTVWDTEAIANRANIRRGTDGNDMYSEYGEAVGYHQSETYHMGQGNDIVFAGEGDDVIHGDGGNDTLYSNNGNDTLIGGAGNDTLVGGDGADVYIIGAGDGDDVIQNNDYTDSRVQDKIVYGEGISVDDISITRSGTDLLISNAKTQQTTVISRAYSDEGNQIYNLEFYDEDTAVIDYATTSLNVTYASKEEITEPASEEVAENDALAEEVIVEEISEAEPVEGITGAEEPVAEITEEIITPVESEEVLYMQEANFEMELVEADNAVIVSEEDITKMTGLMIQEMAGADTTGVPQTVNPDTNVIAESDSLLWSE